MQYLRFLVYICGRHLELYRSFKYSEPIRLYAKNKAAKEKLHRIEQYRLACKAYGVKKFKTLEEISESDRKFELDNPELFPGLSKNNN